jgi:hypothetical protein
MSLSIPETNTQLAEATDAIFQQTPPYIGMSENGVNVLVVNNAVEYVYKKSVDIGVPPQESPMLALFSADIIRRGLIDKEDLIMSSEYKDQISLMIERMNAARVQVANPIVAGELVPVIGGLAFDNVILRPDGLVIPNVERKLHSSDLGDLQNNPLAQSFRLRHNFIKQMLTYGAWSATTERAIQGFITDEGYPDIDKFADRIRSRPESISRRTIEAMAKLGVAQMAARVIVLDYAEQAELMRLKEDYIERGYAIVDRHDSMQQFGEAWLKVDIDDKAAKHVLSGDKSGGGHHLASLDSRFVTQLGRVETIEVTHKSGCRYDIPVSRVQKRNSNGVITSDEVTTFFPAEWTSDAVLKAITSPVRYMYGREKDNGTSEDYVMSNGLLIKRIYTSDAERRLITAFPSVPIPADVIKRLGK